MKFASLGSGSKGNATLIEAGSKLVMLDCGFSMKEAVRRMSLLNISPLDLDALIVTHEHADHIRGIGPLARKYQLPVYMTHGTSMHAGLGQINQHICITSGQSFQLGGLQVLPQAVSHDAREPVQFRFNADGLSLAVITDLGDYDDLLLDAFGGCQGLMLEANHDLDMLMSGPYPEYLKTRVAGTLGHLNNGQAARLLQGLDVSSLQQLILLHLSEANNRPKLALDAFLSVKLPALAEIAIADQDNGLHWRTIL